MGASRLEYINLRIEKDDYFFDIALGGNLYLQFDKKRQRIPSNTLNLVQEGENLVIPMKDDNFHNTKNLEELYSLEKQEPKMMQGCMRKRAIGLARLCMGLQEPNMDAFRHALQNGTDLAKEFSERFLEEHKYEIRRLKVLGMFEAGWMRITNNLFDEIFEGQLRKELENEVDFYSQLYLGWSLLRDSSREYSKRLYNDGNFLEKVLDKEFGQRVKEVSRFYSEISEKTIEPETKLGELFSRTILLYSIYDENLEKPKVGLLKEKIKDKLVNFEMPESWKAFL